MTDKPAQDPELMKQDMAKAHEIIAKCYAQGVNPVDASLQNLRIWGTVYCILQGSKATAAHLRFLAEGLDPISADVADTLLDGVLKSK